MLKFVVLFLIFLWLFIGNGKQKGWDTPSSWLLFIYLLSTFCAIPTIPSDGFTEPLSDYYWIPMFEFAAVLLLFLLPFRQYDETMTVEIVLPYESALKAFSNFIIGISFLSIAFFLPSVGNIFTMASLGDARNDLYSGELYFEVGIFNTIASVGSSLYVFAIVLFFVYLIKGGNKTRCILLFISSVSEVIHVLAYVGRDGVVFWIFSFVFTFLLFKPYLKEYYIKKIYKYFLIGVGIMMVPFFLISLSRFSNNASAAYDSTSSSLLSYMGMGPIDAVLFFGLDNPPCTHGTGFPLYFELTHTKMPESLGPIWIGDWKSWNFSTFVVSFYQNVGLMGTILIGVFMFLVFKILVRKNQQMSFSKMIIYVLYFQILSEGVFYFRQYTRGGNLFILLCFGLYYAFRTLEVNSQNKLNR